MQAVEAARVQEPHPYLVRALQRIADQPELVYRAEVTSTREIAATLVQVRGRVIVERTSETRRLAIDATLERDGSERGVSLRFDGERWSAADHTARVWSQGTHPEVLGSEAGLALHLVIDAFDDSAAWAAHSAQLTFAASERFAGEAVHRFHAPADATGFEAAWSFGADDGLPRRVVERCWVGGAEHEVRSWRMLEWTPRPRFHGDPFALPALVGYRAEAPLPPAVFATDSRPVHSLEASLAPLIERFRASEQRFVVAVVSPT